MGYLEIKPATTSAKLTGNLVNAPNGAALNVSQTSEMTGGKNPSTGNQNADPSSSTKDTISRAKSSDGRADHSEALAPHKIRGGSSANGLDTSLLNLPSGNPKASSFVKNTDETAKLAVEELTTKVASKTALESEVY